MGKMRIRCVRPVIGADRLGTHPDFDRVTVCRDEHILDDTRGPVSEMLDEELFEELTKDLPVIVDFGDDQNRGEGGYVNPATKGKKLSAEDAGKEADRYLGMITPSTAGRGDKVSSMTKKD